MSRPVVAKKSPPPPPVPFAKQQQALAAHPGQPIAPREMQKLASTGAAAPRPMAKPRLPANRRRRPWDIHRISRVNRMLAAQDILQLTSRRTVRPLNRLQLNVRPLQRNRIVRRQPSRIVPNLPDQKLLVRSRTGAARRAAETPPPAERQPQRTPPPAAKPAPPPPHQQPRQTPEQKKQEDEKKKQEKPPGA